MFWNAKNGCIRIGHSDMDYISFGNGKKTLVMLPGLGDGLTTVKGLAAAMAISYRIYAKDFKVYVFSRKNNLEEGCTTKKMAADQAKAMKALGIDHAYVVGISQGGMIAQYLAIDFPRLVQKLVLAATAPKPGRLLQKVVKQWIFMAEHNDYKSLMIDTAKNTYSDKYLKKYRLLYPVLGYVGKPKDFKRFVIQAKSCLTHNACLELHKISCPTFIIGGGCDKIVGANASQELADRIQASELFIYNGLGHGVYEEAKDFNKQILDFIKSENRRMNV